jgi:hypothetical protein
MRMATFAWLRWTSGRRCSTPSQQAKGITRDQVEYAT